jgi:hypothetical protein
MLRKSWLYTVLTVALAAISATVAFMWGSTAGARQSLLVAARSTVLVDIHVAKYLHEDAQRDALSAIDARINSSIMEIAQLSSGATPGSKTEDSAVLVAVAKFRQKYPDTSGASGISPSSDHVRDLLSPYAK